LSGFLSANLGPFGTHTSSNTYNLVDTSSKTYAKHHYQEDANDLTTKTAINIFKTPLQSKYAQALDEDSVDSPFGTKKIKYSGVTEIEKVKTLDEFLALVKTNMDKCNEAEQKLNCIKERTDFHYNDSLQTYEKYCSLIK